MNSIRLVADEKPSGGVGAIVPLILPDLKNRYGRRAGRLRQLAEAHPMADYLRFAAGIAEAQQQVAEALPLPAALAATLPARLGGARPPLEATSLPRERHWRDLLQALFGRLQDSPTPAVAQTLAGLRSCDGVALEKLADALLAGDYRVVGSDRAPFLWAALSLYWTQMAAQLPASGQAGVGEGRQCCPVCGGAPVASVIRGGAQSGLRYLHCGLCESRWHMVRTKCSNCEEGGRLDYWSLDSEQAAIRAESCGDCNSYLKVLHEDRDPQLEVIADDLASLALDAEVERQGFYRSGLNPFLFPG
ncbi:formate dehydrogenase accessory protein FdhE [Azotobacter salinestris]|uniref:formate dehydrogenase accessory protein FdhE n=1 Tax=Azotobacter salinestris TaxID=69964 RepID=UPI00126698B0|nr:formate dehydrogenase accessory protein FdhE [Azotobacter salinestris]